MTTRPEIERLRNYLELAELTPEARVQLDTLLEKAENGDEIALERIRKIAFERGGYQSVPGKDITLPPGRVMVCPEDPSHYQILQHEIGETLLCPLHEVALIPQDFSD